MDSFSLLCQMARMIRIGFILFCLILAGCKDNKKEEKDNDGFSYEGFSGQFRDLTLPYQLTDTALLKNRDTTSIRSPEFATYLPDSLKTKLFGKTTKVRYIAMGKLPAKKDITYYMVKAVAGNKPVALLYAFSGSRFGGVIPFLFPDTDPATFQSSIVERSHSVLINISRRSSNITEDGKDVYEYYPDMGQFALILTNPLSRPNADIPNPIDTMARTHKFSGDYIKDKKNFVSVRDGRYANQLTIFIHIEKNNGTCTGELKGEILMTSATSGIYQQGGDPCVLSFRFGSNSVTLEEQSGCGSRRGVDCVLDGTFSRKKVVKPKSTSKKN